MKRWSIDNLNKGQRIVLFVLMVVAMAGIGYFAVLASNTVPAETTQQVTPGNNSNQGTETPDEPAKNTFDHDEHLMADQVLTLAAALGGADPTLSLKATLDSVTGFVTPSVLKQVEAAYPTDMAALKAERYYRYVDVTYQQDVTSISGLDANQRIIVAKGDILASKNGEDPTLVEARQWRFTFTADNKGVWTITDVTSQTL